jgi:hypothetical protein
MTFRRGGVFQPPWWSARPSCSVKISSFEREVMILRAHLRPSVRVRSQRALLCAVETLVRDRDHDDAAWTRLAEHYKSRQLIGSRCGLLTTTAWQPPFTSCVSRENCESDSMKDLRNMAR